MVRGLVLASLLVQMWPVNAVQARTLARVAEVASTPVPPAQGDTVPPVVRDVPVAQPSLSATPSSSTVTVEPTLSTTALPSPTPVDTPIPVTPTATATPSGDPWPIEDVPPTSDESQDSKKGQDNVFVGGRVKISVPDKVDVAKLRVQMKEAKRLKKGEQGLAFVIDITAKDKGDKDAKKFPEPITVTLKIADLLGTLDQGIYIAYFDGVTQEWIPVNIVDRDPQAGTVTILTDHFTPFGGGLNPSISQVTSPAAWAMKFNDSNVSLFDGSMNWNYPLDIPAGPGGIRPYVSLSYNSRRVDGILAWPNPAKPSPVEIQPDMGYGWDLDVPEIAFGGIGGWIEPVNGTVGRFGWRPYWTLRLNGQSIRVVPSLELNQQIAAGPQNTTEGKMWQYHRYCTNNDGVTIPSVPGVRTTPLVLTVLPYQAEDRKDLRIRWLCGDATQAAENGYWEVTTGDGTKYLFGSADDSKQTISGYAVEAGIGTFSIRWRLKEIRTTKNVSAIFAYNTDSTIPPCCAATAKYDYQTYLSTITYPGTKIVFNWTANKAPLTSVELQREKGVAPGQYLAVKRWSFAYSNKASLEANDGNARRVLDSIIEKGVQVNGTELALPATTFLYTSLRNKDICSNPTCHIPSDSNHSYYYPRLTTINNGYGAKIGVTYSTPDAGYWHNLNWRIATREIRDGMDVLSVAVVGVNGWREEYTYSTARCYVNPNDPYAVGCYNQTSFTTMPWIPNNSCGECLNLTGGGFIGYNSATVVYKPLPVNGSTVLKKRVVNFWVSSRPAFGRVVDETIRDAADVEMQKSWKTYSVNWTDVNWISVRIDAFPEPMHYLNSTVWLTSAYFKRDGYTARTEYQYDSFDNPKIVVENGFVDGAGANSAGWTGDERTARRTYNNSTSTGGNWFVGLLTRENIYAGVDSGANPVGSPITENMYYYDGATLNPDGAPSQGILTAIRRGKSNDLAISSSGYVTSSFQYDAWGNMTKAWDAIANANNAAASVTAEYDGALHTYMTYYTNTLVQATRYIYYCVDLEACLTTSPGPLGALKAIRDPNSDGSGSVQTIFEYDPLGRLVKSYAPYDSSTNPTQEYVYSDGSAGGTALTAPLKVTTRQYSAPGVYVFSRQFYDGLGRLVQMQAPAGTWTNVTGAALNISNVTYDALGRTSTQSVPYGDTETYAYKTPNTGVPKTTTQYDSLSRALQVTGLDGVNSWLRYDGLNNKWRTRLVDGNGHGKAQSTDGLGRMTRVEEYTGACTTPDSCSGNWAVYATTNYTYDVLDNLKTVVDAANNTTTINYDALSRKINMTDPDMGYWQYGYAANDNLIGQLDPNGNRICMWYDGLNRMKGKLYDVAASSACGTRADPGYSGYHMRYYYDNTGGSGYRVGRRTEAQSWPGGSWSNTVSYGYDKRGRVISVRRFGSGTFGDYTTTYAYDSADRVTTTTYPDLEAVTTAYNAAGQPNTLTGSGYQFVNGATYNALGQITQMGHPNTLATQYRYYGLNYNPGTTASYGRLRGICVSSLATCADDNNDSGKPSFTNASSVRLNLAYAYDSGNVNITSIGDRTRDQGQKFTYDALDRLTNACTTTSAAPATCFTSADTSTYNESYTHDTIGNMTYKSNIGTMAYNGPKWNTSGQIVGNAPHAVGNVNSGGRLYDYDLNGNMIKRNDGVIKKFTWTAENKLASVTDNAGAALAQFTYDADNTLVKAQDPSGQITITVGSHYEINTTANVIIKYYFFGGKPVAVRKGTTLRWLGGDHLGSASLSTDASGVATVNQRYMPYGGVRYTDATAFITDRQFTGARRFEGSTGDVYQMGARFYDPVIGRFLSPDTMVPRPGDPQAFNRYMYARANPLLRIDLSGHADGVVASVAEFIAGFTTGLSEANLPNAPAWMQSTANAMTVQDSSFAAGRAVGNVAGIVQGLSEIVGGSGGVVGGGTLCLTGVGCLGGAPLAIASSAVVVHGLVVAINSVDKLNGTITLMAKKGSGSNIDEVPDNESSNKGSLTEPTLPPRNVIQQDGVTVEHYYRSGDHGPAHLHVYGNGSPTKIGQNGKPVEGSPELSAGQQRVVQANKSLIRKTIDKIQRWFKSSETKAE